MSKFKEKNKENNNELKIIIKQNETNFDTQKAQQIIIKSERNRKKRSDDNIDIEVNINKKH